MSTDAHALSIKSAAAAYDVLEWLEPRRPFNAPNATTIAVARMAMPMSASTRVKAADRCAAVPTVVISASGKRRTRS